MDYLEYLYYTKKYYNNRISRKVICSREKERYNAEINSIKIIIFKYITEAIRNDKCVKE